jgi:hypothetical protein
LQGLIGGTGEFTRLCANLLITAAALVEVQCASSTSWGRMCQERLGGLGNPTGWERKGREKEQRGGEPEQKFLEGAE